MERGRGQKEREEGAKRGKRERREGMRREGGLENVSP
jgi:hypothetical protein